MSKTTLQVPITTQLKWEAEVIVKEMGFPSLPCAVRLILIQIASKQLQLTFYQQQFKTIPLQERRPLPQMSDYMD